MAWRPGLFVFNALLLFVSPLAAHAQWQPGGNLVTDTVHFSAGIDVIPDGAGGVFTSWQDSRNGDSHAYVQRFGSDGAALWTEGGNRAVTDEYSFHPRMAPDGTGGVFLALRAGQAALDIDLRVQRLSSAGIAVWSSSVSVSPTAGDGFPTRLLPDGSGGVIVVWWRQGLIEDRGIFAQRIDASGNRLWGDDAVRVTDFDGTPQICGDGAGGVYVTWADRRVMPHHDIYAQHVSAGGTTSWAENGVLVCGVEFTQTDPQIVADGGGGAIVAWRDYGQTPVGFYTQRLNADGSARWQPNGELVLAGSPIGEEFSLAPDGSGGAVVAASFGWLGGQDIRAQRFDGDGQNLWLVSGVAVCTAPGSQSDPQLAMGPDGSAYVAWRDHRNGCGDIFAQKLSPTGSSVWTHDGVMVAVFDEDQIEPRIVAGGPEEIYAYWRDQRGEQDRLFLLPIGAAGSGVSEECTVRPDHVPDAQRSALTLENFPNPFNPRTVFRFRVESAGPVRLLVYDAAGRRVATVMDEVVAAGDHAVEWNARGSDGIELPSGVYVARLDTTWETVVRKLALVR